jgi:hypothetical protein
VLSQGAEQAGTDSGHLIEPRKPTEPTVRVSVGHHALGERHADPREPGELRGSGAIGVDPLAGAEGASERQHAVTMRKRGLWRQGLQQLDLAGWCSGGNQPVTDAVAKETQGQQQEKRPPLGSRHGVRLACGSPGHGPAPVRHGAEFRGYCRRTKAMATSPTICRLRSLTLSSLSSGVCHEG